MQHIVIKFKAEFEQSCDLEQCFSKLQQNKNDAMCLQSV